MNFKEELKSLVDKVKGTAKAAGIKLTNEEIAKRMGYTRTHFSTLVSGPAKVEKDLVDTFRERFRAELDGVYKPSAPGEELNRERAIIKMLFHRVAKLEAERLGIPVEKALEEMERDTRIALRDLKEE